MRVSAILSWEEEISTILFGMKLFLSGELNQYLHEFEEECNEKMEQITEQIKLKEGVTEELKAKDQMKWVGMMNNIRARAEEMVVREVVYCLNN